MNILNQKFDKIVCINLAERPDKKKKMQAKFDQLEIEVEWFTTVQYGFIPKIIKPIIDFKVGHFNLHQPYEIGAALSHYTVLKQAILEGCNSIFIFEDDAKFHINFNDKIDKYLNDLPDHWDMIMLYSFMYQLLPENKRIKARWMTSYRAWSLMSYGIKRNLMEEYIKRQDNFFTISDAVTYNLQHEGNFKIYSAVPALCIPETELGSNIRGQSMNYKNTPTITNLGYSDENYK